MLGHVRWDELIQQVANEREEMPWQAKAQNRELWAGIETVCVSSALRLPRQHVHALPPGRHMMPGMRIPPEVALAGMGGRQKT